MFNFDKTDAQRIAVSAAGALALSAVSVVAAAAPVRAETPALTATAWQANVQHQLDGSQNVRLGVNDGPQVGTTVLTASFDASGRFQDATIARSSGDAAIDRDALRAARAIDYPALPATAARTVNLRVYFAATDRDAAREMLRDQAKVRVASNDAGGRVTAAAR
ncbi:energy transducer TonB family protein [Sphingomonas nostoxanthinifaciens]|uniref:energy transducer TonB family protein n=1 Tax=Sphingomonas nostoxanthinifaciens TaxID=2872652 RepID=UPI001CC1FA04|nr:energy transducer TonB [Sphingomonas nostoxanthinifaciens]UAK26015.1 energy transducer TonB [Sphingomonas nostoxanthinifaciens]